MSRFQDALRCTLISPEIVLLLGAVAISVNSRPMVGFLSAQVESNILIGSGVAIAPVAMLAWGWNQVWEMLDPGGEGQDLNDWPHYYMLKFRVMSCLAWCGMGSIMGFIAIAMISMKWAQDIGVGLLLGGVLAAVSATVSLAIARLKLREMIALV